MQLFARIPRLAALLAASLFCAVWPSAAHAAAPAADANVRLDADTARAPDPASVSLPDTPEGRHIQAFLAVLARPEPAAIREFVSTHYAPSALAQLPLEARVDRLRGIASDLGPLELVRVLAAADGHAEFVARSSRKGETLTI